ncbi:MAG: hypothetical protein J6J42_07180 [Lachnospiraceae bacterium]|nr:hypothetical protein [Lachnospiraceae bacterium]
MEKKKSKGTKVALCVVIGVIAVLLCCLIGLKIQAEKKWKHGIYLHDFDICVNSYEEPMFKVTTLIIGEEFLDIAGNGSLSCVMVGEEGTIPATCKMTYYCEAGKGYQAAFDIYPELGPGEYHFNEIQLWNGFECITAATGTARFNVMESEEELQEGYDFTLVNCWMNTSQCEFLYQLVNESDKEMEILSFEGRLHSFVEEEKITIVNNVDIEETNINFNTEKVFKTPLLLEAGKKAYIRYVVPLEEKERFTNLLAYPFLVYQSAEGKEPLKLLLNGYCIPSVLPVTQEQIVDYIAERGNQ